MDTQFFSSDRDPSPLHHKAFALFWFARVSTAMAFQIQGVAVGWQIYSLTGSTSYLGLVGLAQFVPMFFLTLVVGHVADRYDRRLVSRMCQLAGGPATGTLAFASFTGWQSKESILAIVFIIAAARAFETPTMQALVPELIPVRLLSRAFAWTAPATRRTTCIKGLRKNILVNQTGKTTLRATLTS